MKKIILLFIAIGWSWMFASAQNQESSTIQYWDFMVRTTAQLQEIAVRFHVSESDIRKKSAIKGKTVYPGKILSIPVHVKPTTWDPSKFNPNKPFLSTEDARPQAEYEWDTDSLDPMVKDDFIRIAEIQGDSIQTEKMTKHVERIDKRIKFLNHQVDSIKNAEFAFQYDEKDMNSVLKRMEQARQRYYAQSPYGKETDSLNAVKVKLNEEINRLRNRLSEYEYLTENAYFFEKNREGEREMYERLDNRPGEQLIAESNLLKKADLEKKKIHKKKKRKKKEAQEEPIVEEQLQSKDIVRKDTLAAVVKPIEQQAKENTPSDNTPTTVTKTVVDNVTTVSKTSAENITNAAPTTKENTTPSSPNNTLLSTKITLTPKEQPVVVNKPIETTTTYTKAKEETTPAPSNKTNVDSSPVSNSNDNTTKPVVESKENVRTLPVEVAQNTTTDYLSDNAPKPNNTVQKRDSGILETLTTGAKIKPLHERDLANREEIKKAIARKVIPKEEDPLDQYSESPDFAFRGLMFKAIPIEKTKNGPKYLTPADPITVLKAKIFIEQFKEDMKVLDFKKAESSLRKSLDINPNNAEAWTYHAEMLSASGDAPAALNEYMIATTIDVTYSRAYFKMALLYEKSNNIDKAYDYYSRAIDADSANYKAYLFRAALSVKQEDRKSAIEDYTALLEVNSNFSLAYKERGILRMIERNYSGAAEDFSSYLEIEDPNGEVLYRRGIARVYSGKIIDGCNDFNTALQLKFPEAEKAIKKYCE